MDLFDIRGKKAIVTGGTRGLGYKMAEGYLEAGCQVVIVGTSPKVYEVAQEFRDRGYDCQGVMTGRIFTGFFRNVWKSWEEIWTSFSQPMGSRDATAQRNFLWRNGMKSSA